MTRISIKSRFTTKDCEFPLYVHRCKQWVTANVIWDQFDQSLALKITVLTLFQLNISHCIHIKPFAEVWGSLHVTMGWKTNVSRTTPFVLSRSTHHIYWPQMCHDHQFIYSKLMFGQWTGADTSETTKTSIATTLGQNFGIVSTRQKTLSFFCPVRHAF